MIMADTPFYMKKESEALLPSDSLLAGDDVLPSNGEYTLPYLKTDIPLEAAVIKPYYYRWVDTPFYQNDDINDGLPYLLSDVYLTPNVIQPYYYHWKDTPFYQSSDINDGLPYLKTDIPLAPSVIEPYYYHWIDTPFYQSSNINDGLPYLLSDVFLDSDGPDAAIIHNNILQLMLMFNPNTINVKGV